MTISTARPFLRIVNSKCVKIYYCCRQRHVNRDGKVVRLMFGYRCCIDDDDNDIDLRDFLDDNETFAIGYDDD